MQKKINITRNTKETQIQVQLTLNAQGDSNIQTGLPFFDHMLQAMAKHGFINLDLNAKGDLQIDPHHTIEDIGIVLGQAIKKAVGDKKGINRFGTAYVPMDEALVRAVIDLSGRPHLSTNIELGYCQIANIPVRLFTEFFQALVNNSNMTLHIDLIRGKDLHHIFEATFKALGKALNQAIQNNPQNNNSIPSTKGILE